jgi:hypothetical protein
MVEKITLHSIREQPIGENEQVATAQSPRRMKPLLEQIFPPEIEKSEAPKKMSSSQGRNQECHILDMKYEAGDYCTILYQFGDQFVTGSYQWGSSKSQSPEGTKLIPSLGMRVYRFPNDPVLPSLTKALDPQTVSAALADVLPEIQSGTARILRCDVRPLRFRPGRRCTVRLNLWLRETGSEAIYNRVLYGKIYHDLEKAERVYRQMVSLSRSISIKDGQSSFATACAFLPDLAMVLQDPMEGTPLDSLISCNTETCDPRAFAGMTLAASALAVFHGSGLVDGKSRSISSELVRFKKRGAGIGQVHRELGDAIIKLSGALATWLDTLDQWGATACMVHGDCKPAQFLIGDQQVALLDFDHCGMADPAVDVGTFLATLQQMQVKQILKNRGMPVHCSTWMPDLKEQFLDTYCMLSNAPSGFIQRAGWYEVVGLLRKAIRGFERSPSSPLPAALIAAAWGILETLPPPSGNRVFSPDR